MAKRWEPSALRWLTRNAPRMRFDVLLRRYNEIAPARGWEARTESAMRTRLSILGLGSSHAVVRLDTGQEYPTPKNAARAVGVTPESIRAALRKGGRSGGYSWAYVHELEDKRA